jgi:hypothetical protein
MTKEERDQNLVEASQDSKLAYRTRMRASEYVSFLQAKALAKKLVNIISGMLKSTKDG